MFYQPPPSQLPQSEPEPSEWNASHHGPGLEISKDKLTVKYTTDARHSNDIGTIQSNRPVPLKRLVYYFEVTIRDGMEGTSSVAIGFSHKNFNTTKHPGNDTNSFGYLGEDGKKYQHGNKGEDYASPFGKGDTIGAGIHLARQEIFFTRNGTRLKTAFGAVKGTLYPTISLHRKNECVEVNFGRKPFKFDVEWMISEEREQQRQQISSIPLSSGVAHNMVRSYLLHYGYADTLAAFEEAAGLSGERRDTPEALALQQRKSIRRLLVAGDVDGAMKLLHQHYPELLSEQSGNEELMFGLHCQKYLELLRQRKVDAAVVYLQSSLVQCQAKLQSPRLEASLRDVVAVIAYEQPEASPLAHLLSQGHREAVADVVNEAILVHTQGASTRAPPKSLLETLLRQLVAVQQTLLEENGGQGEFLPLDNCIRSTTAAPEQPAATATKAAVYPA